MTFALDRAGLFEILKAEATLEETILVEKVVKTNHTSAENSKAEDKEAETSSPSPSADTAEDLNATNVEMKPQLTVHRVSLTKKLIRGDNSLAARRLSTSDVMAARAKLYKLDESDRKRHERANSLNSLESAIFYLREKLYSDEQLVEVSTDEEREAIREKLEAAEDWCFTEEASTAQKLSAKEKELRAIVDKVILRATEVDARAKAVEELQKAIEVANTTCALMRQVERMLAALPAPSSFCAPSTLVEPLLSRSLPTAHSPPVASIPGSVTHTVWCFLWPLPGPRGEELEWGRCHRRVCQGNTDRSRLVGLVVESPGAEGAEGRSCVPERRRRESSTKPRQGRLKAAEIASAQATQPHPRAFDQCRGGRHGPRGSR